MDVAPSTPALVVSHERSGTHFLINTLAANFGYRPRSDLERRPGFDPGSTAQMLDFLTWPWPAETVVKSHHQAGFFPALRQFARQFHIFYVVRDPRDVLLSFWRYLASSGPEVGPQAESLGAFVRAEPQGFIATYQRHTLTSMAERWRVHVDGWLDALDDLEGRATLVRYDDLDERFGDEVARLAAIVDVPPPEVARRPALHQAVIHVGEGGSGKFRAYLDEADLDFVHSQTGDTMRRLGYSLG